MTPANAIPPAGTGGLNVPMFIALRRFTLVTTMLLERSIYKRKHDRSTYGAVGTMIMGENHPRQPSSWEVSIHSHRCAVAPAGHCSCSVSPTFRYCCRASGGQLLTMPPMS